MSILMTSIEESRRVEDDHPALVAGADDEATPITNDESTWTSATPATATDQACFDRYVGAMGVDFVRSAVEGQEEVSLQTNSYPIRADILSNGDTAIEVKVGYVHGGGSFYPGQVSNYVDARDSGAITNFYTVFLKSPTSGLTGPSQSVADGLRANGVNGVTFPLDWWDSYY